MGKLFCFFLLSVISWTNLVATVITGYGDLYVIYNLDKSIRIIAANNNGTVVDTTFLSLPASLRLHYYAADSLTNVNFSFSLHDPIEYTDSQLLPEKTLVVSDLHGRLDAFVALLKGNGVIDTELNWVYGSNRLVYVGDILDRGRDDNGIAWLLYKLQADAFNAGGQVDFLPGNHEDLVLKNDLRYSHKAHLEFAEKIGMSYSELYGNETELGRWIRNSPLIVKAGEILFVHAGLSRQIVDSLYTVEEMNELSVRYLGYPTKIRKKMHPRNELMFGNSGPLWYRGLVYDTEKHPPISKQDLEEVLGYYAVSRIVVGHSEVSEIDWRYGGKVIAVNVKHYKNFPERRSAGLLIENADYYAVDYEGNKKLLSK